MRKMEVNGGTLADWRYLELDFTIHYYGWFRTNGVYSAAMFRME